MRDVTHKPALHLFVCANRRDAASPLGGGCAERGELLYDELKREVAARGAYASIWVTKTHCLGICPRVGATVAVHADGDPSERLVTEVLPADAAALLR